MAHRRINWDKIAEHMEKEVEDNFFGKCVICGMVVSDVKGHLKKHKEMGL